MIPLPILPTEECVGPCLLTQHKNCVRIADKMQYLFISHEIFHGMFKTDPSLQAAALFGPTSQPFPLVVALGPLFPF